MFLRDQVDPEHHSSTSTLLATFSVLQCWDYCHFHESECESLSYESESESTKTQDHESKCESESECHEFEYESESTKTEDHESEFENLTGKWNLKFGQSYFNMDKRFQKFRKKTFVQRFCKRCTMHSLLTRPFTHRKKLHKRFCKSSCK